MACNALNVTWSVQKCSSGLFFMKGEVERTLSFFCFSGRKYTKQWGHEFSLIFSPFHFGICEYNTQFLECNVTTLFRSCSSLCFSHPHIYHCSTQSRAFVGLHRRCPDVAAFAGAVYYNPPSCSDHLSLIRSPFRRIVEPRSQNCFRCSSLALSHFFTSTFAQLVHRHCW